MKLRIPIALAGVTVGAAAATLAVPSCNPQPDVGYACEQAFTDAGVFRDVTCPQPSLDGGPHCPPGCELVMLV